MAASRERAVRTSVPGIRWPAIPSQAGAALLAMQFQLEQSQWWPPETLREHQFAQLDRLLRHARETVPFYQERLEAAGIGSGSGLTAEQFGAIPPLSRRELQASGAELLSRSPPPDHGRLHQHRTSGATGRPVTVTGTEFNGFLWLALTLREHLWQHRDFSAKLAVIRYTKAPEAGAPPGLHRNGWGPATDTAYATGPLAMLNIIHNPVDAQLAWLRREDPDYLLTYPSNLAALVEKIRANNVYYLHRMREIRTFSESLSDEVRAACQEVLGVPVVDAYSAQEVGYIALQCPDYPQHYHLQSETVLVEVLNDDGCPCAPGQVGRVVVTSLHNFAMPLIRYELGDYAEVGGPCPCGRGLPAIRRVLGRVRNMLTLPSGDQVWPRLSIRRYAKAVGADIQQAQVVQESLERVRLKLVAGEPLTPAQEQSLVTLLQDALRHPYHITIETLDAIPRSPSGKYEEFISEVSAPARPQAPGTP